jgi:hypothetical protein
VRSAAIFIREFSMSWKLNFCKRESKLIKKQIYVGSKDMTDQAWIYWLSKHVGLRAKVSAKGVYHRSGAIPAVWLEPPSKDDL